MTVGWLSPHSVPDNPRLPLRGGVIADDGWVARSPDLPKAERKLFTVLLCSLRCRTLVLPQAKSSAVGNFTQPIMN